VYTPRGALHATLGRAVVRRRSSRSFRCFADFITVEEEAGLAAAIARAA
jgi:hypothetical protein